MRYIMKNIFNKTNAPYLASGALAIGTLLTSGIFAVAPYIGFLVPVAALSFGLPFVIGSVVFSAAAIALSAVVIQKNGAIRRQSALLDEEAKKKAELTLKSEEKDAQLTKKKAEVQAQKQENSELKNKIAAQQQKNSKQDDEIFSLKEQLDEKKNEVEALKTRLAEKNKELKDKDTVISCLDAQSVKKDAEMQEQLDKKVKCIINSDEDTRRIHQGRKERNREEVLYPVALSDLFYENPSPEKRPVKEGNSQSWTEWGIGNTKAAAQLAMKGAMFAAFAAPYIYTFFEQPEISPAGQTLFQSEVGNQSTDSVPSFILEKLSYAVPFGMHTASH